MIFDAPKPKRANAHKARVPRSPRPVASSAVANAAPIRVRESAAKPLVAALMLAMVAAAPVRADEADYKALMVQLQRIEAQIRALDAKVTALEQAQKTSASAEATKRSSPAEPAATGAPVPAITTSEVAAQAVAQLRREDAAVRDGWKQIERGLSQEEVKRLLGAPQQTFDLSGKKVWYYYYPADGSGSVLFDPGGRVVGYQTPPSSGFRLY
jgi:hypothetical protein